MKTVSANFVFSILICVVFSAPQNPETNQFEDSNYTEIQPPETQIPPEVPHHTAIEKLPETFPKPDTEPVTYNNNPETTTTTKPKDTKIQQQNVITKLYIAIREPILKFLKAPKVSIVITNIGTCIVNGAMEIISFYFPAPLIPLIASAAGLVIPFEPIVMLRERMPVTSYGRAFKTAVDGFLGTFDRYKYEDDDPYMTGKFNRRFMRDSKEVKEETEKIVVKDSVQS